MTSHQSVTIDAICFGQIMCSKCREQFRRGYTGFYKIPFVDYTTGVEVRDVFHGVDLCHDCLLEIVESGKQVYETTRDNYFGWPVEATFLHVMWDASREFTFPKRRVSVSSFTIIGPAITGLRNWGKN